MNLVCDICSGKLSMVAGGVAVCEICGMEHSKERLIEKLDHTEGAIPKKNNFSQIETWMRMGEMASESGNYSEAYQYFTKIVEADPDNWRAIFEKGKAAAWQSTLGNLRISELYQGVNHALSLIDNLELTKDEVVLIKNEFAMELFEINNTITDLIQNNFDNKMDLYLDIHLEEWFNVRDSLVKNIERIEDAMLLIQEFNDELSRENVLSMKQRICTDLVSLCYSMHFFWIDVLETDYVFVGLNAEDKVEYIDKFTKIIKDVHKVDPNYGKGKYSVPDPFDPPLAYNKKVSITDDRYAEITLYWNKVYAKQAKEEREKEEQKKLKKYWKEHKEEKELLETEKSRLLEEVEILKRDKKKLPERTTLSNLKRELEKLEHEKSELGFFKNKEKRQKQQEIDKLKEEYLDVESRLNKVTGEIKDKIEILKNEVKKIEKELTRPR